MKRLHSILTGLALGAFSLPAWAIQIPVSRDTAGNTAKNTISKLAGKATTLPVSSKSTALLFFDLSSSGIDSSAVTGARLVIYVSKVTKPGNLGIAFPTSVFQETFATGNIPLPTVTDTGSPLAITAANSKSYVVVAGFQSVVSTWLDNPSSNFGIALTGDAALSASLTSKEGSVGTSAVLEIDVNPAGTINVSSVTASGIVAGASITSTGSVTATGDVEVGGNVTASFIGSSSMATDTLTVHETATLKGQTNLQGDVTLSAGKVIGGAGSIGVSGLIGTTGQIRASTVGVGLFSSNSRGKLEVSGTINRAGTFSLASSYNNAPAANNINGTLATFIPPGSDTGGSTSIFSDGAMIASVFTAISDARIKDIQGRSDSAVDLAKLRSIEITDYLYKDKVNRGSRPQKKVIAQQVEEVFPQAVNRSTDVVPDIYQKAVSTDGWVDLATDLMVGDRVRLIGEKDDEDSIQEVLEVSESGFRTAFQPTGTQVFVYGREVKDFRSVDYEAIAMLNVSASQELAKQLAAKDAELNDLRAANTTLAAKVAALEARTTARIDFDAALAARLARLEATLVERPAAATTASLDLE